MLTRKPAVTLLLSIIALCSAFAQDFFSHLEKPQPGEGEIHIYQDYQIRKVTELYSEYRSDSKGFRGYRINIFSESGQGAREKAIEARSKFINHFDDTEVYLEPDSPWWRVYVGKFYIKSDAQKFLEKISHIFPEDAYIVPYYFNLPEE
ncbi:MAG: hypothetical protein GVY19_10030 [Bacteroidetes bacterium]|jgi:hypothetical protein|nr:hypothetical protein [Bacteroidota bacterium]